MTIVSTASLRTLDLGTGQPLPAITGHGPETDHALPDFVPLVSAAAIGGQYGRFYKFRTAGQRNQGHRHTFDHVTWIVSGSVRVEADGQEPIEVVAPFALLVPAGVAHRFTALEDGTSYICTHQIDPAKPTGEAITALVDLSRSK